jgi:hypothetical protein
MHLSAGFPAVFISPPMTKEVNMDKSKLSRHVLLFVSSTSTGRRLTKKEEYECPQIYCGHLFLFRQSHWQPLARNKPNLFLMSALQCSRETEKYICRDEQNKGEDMVITSMSFPVMPVNSELTWLPLFI